jgi:hypothetical protein
LVKWRQQGRRALREVFELGQRVGLDVLPRHFYSAVPDMAALGRSTQWRTPHSMAGVTGAGIEQQSAFLSGCFTDEVRQHLAARSVYDEAVARYGSLGYGPIEAEILYAFVATHRPPRIVQVGAGLTTALMLAVAHDFGFEMDIISIDPFPTSFLTEAARRGDITLLPTPAQDVDLAVLTDVGPGGMLFVDSTHTVKPGSEVNRIVLEALLQLPPGSFAHFHDITFPYDYPPDLLEGRLFFWQESALLLAFLTGNPTARIAASTSMLHHARPDVLEALLPRYHPMPVAAGLKAGEGHFPSATYLQFG